MCDLQKTLSYFPQPGWCMKISSQSGPIEISVFQALAITLWVKETHLKSLPFSPQVALATEIPDYNQMTLPLGGSHTATAAQMRHFCRSYEFQLPTQPSSLSPPLPPPPTVQFSTLGPGGRHVYCNIPMTLLNGQVQDRKGQTFFLYPPLFPVDFFPPWSCLEWTSSLHHIQICHYES